ncbi:serine/threonine-protein kinase [Antrihabitans cavernicola]|uniref:non-specific serine/threonine protein kinase n=1 Tax=Antrihabitans cavernicola TaxID=2495913 RepID=A0A5A7S7L6_9NOCA|nr:serine/threonine-protein kinase [Spelaeibacter cavernicola]KAA0021484.1 serine/threonine protein kinase [Spelaeibacter cavernicola]
MPLRPGSMVGGYRIQRVLGAGGMGTVYLAQHPVLPRTDALKILSGDLSSDDEFRARFEREANLAAGLDHPNIVSVYNRGEEDGQLWIAMQYIPGTDAGAEVKKGPTVMPPDRSLRIISEVGKGLDYAHRRGLLHRDIKPANFLLSDSDGEERVLLTDFGVAKTTDDKQELTQTGSILATMAYAPPEQLSGSPLDHRADIYSLGCSLYKLLTGQNPFPSQLPAVVMMGHLHEPPPRPSVTHRGLPPAIDNVIAKAMAKDPAARYGSCRELSDAAAAALRPGSKAADFPPVAHYAPTYTPPAAAGPDYSENATTVKRRPPSSGRGKWIAATATACVTVLIAGLVIWGVTRNGDNSSDANAAAETSTSAASSVDQIRKDNPQFEGKTLTAFDFDGTTLAEKVDVQLGGSSQANFLQDIGFTYNLQYANSSGEPSPRPLDLDATSLIDLKSDIVLVFRSDDQAGGGGLRGLPVEISSTRAKVIAIDDPATVVAFRNWSDRSQGVMIDKLVPLLSNRIK